MPARALIVVALFAAVAAGCAGEADANPPATRRVDVGGYELSITCRGESGGPTVVIEAGRGNVSGDWEKVEPEVAKFARVCSYDRAGLGNSDARPATATGAEVADELHALLANAGIEPPYVLAAHSIGVLYSRLFAEQHAGDIVGMVFFDGSHEEQFTSGGEDASTFGDEGSSRIDLTDAVAQLQNARDLGDLPLVVVHGGLNTDAAWFGYHYKQALLSDNSQLVIANRSGHFPYDDQPELVTQAIRLAVDAARSDAALADCAAAFEESESMCVPLTR